MPIRLGPGSVPQAVSHYKSPARGRVYTVSGVTRDSVGNPLGSCTVHLFRSKDDTLVDQQVSDASGNYTFITANPADTYYVVAYLAGSPDVAGTSVNTLPGVESA
jgi:hypothetical protein